MSDGIMYQCGCVKPNRDVKKDEVLVLNTFRFPCGKHFREWFPLPQALLLDCHTDVST